MIKKSFVTRQQIAEELGIDVKTFRCCLKRYNINLKPGLVPIGVAEEIKVVFGKFKLSEDSLKSGMKFDTTN